MFGRPACCHSNQRAFQEFQEIMKFHKMKHWFWLLFNLKNQVGGSLSSTEPPPRKGVIRPPGKVDVTQTMLTHVASEATLAKNNRTLRTFQHERETSLDLTCSMASSRRSGPGGLVQEAFFFLGSGPGGSIRFSPRSVRASLKLDSLWLCSLCCVSWLLFPQWMDG